MGPIGKAVQASSPSGSPFGGKVDIGNPDFLDSILDSIAGAVNKGWLNLGAMVLIIAAIVKPDSFAWLKDPSKLKSVVGLIKDGWELFQPLIAIKMDDEQEQGIDHMLDLITMFLGKDSVVEEIEQLQGKFTQRRV